MFRERKGVLFYKRNLIKRSSPVQIANVRAPENTTQQNISASCIYTYFPFIKKCIPISLIFIGLFLITNGQNNAIEYGFHSGLNLNSAYGEAVFKKYNSVLSGVSISGHVKIKKRKQFGLKIILAYDQYGWAYRSLTFADSTWPTKGDVLFKLNYLNLPVLAEYSFGKKIRYYIDGGVFCGLLLSNHLVTRLKNAAPPYQETVTKTKSDSRKTANFGLSLGLGLQIPITSKIKLNVGLRNSTGLTNINKSSSAYTSTIKLKSFSILGGLVFEM